MVTDRHLSQTGYRYHLFQVNGCTASTPAPKVQIIERILTETEVNVNKNVF